MSPINALGVLHEETEEKPSNVEEVSLRDFFTIKPDKSSENMSKKTTTPASTNLLRTIRSPGWFVDLKESLRKQLRKSKATQTSEEDFVDKA
jgi:hypothetical protein